MKKRLLALLIVVISKSLIADNYDLFSGISYGQTKHVFSVDGKDYSDDYKDDLILKLGLVNDEGRIYTQFDYHQIDDLTKYTLMLNMDTFTEPIYFNYKKLYLSYGAQIGLIKADYDDTYATKNMSEIGLAYGLQCSTILELTEKMQLELGVSSVWSQVKFNNVEYKNSYKSSYNKIDELKFYNAKSWFVGVNYRF